MLLVSYAPILKMDQFHEQRILVKNSCVKLGTKFTETNEMLKQIYGDH